MKLLKTMRKIALLSVSPQRKPRVFKVCDDLIIELTWGVMSLGHRFKDDLYPPSLEDIKFLKDHEKHRIF